MISISSRWRSSARRIAEATDRIAASVRSPPRKKPAPRSSRMASRKRLSKPSSDSAVSTPGWPRAAVAICDAVAGGTPGLRKISSVGGKGLPSGPPAPLRDPGRRGGTARGPRRSRRLRTLATRVSAAIFSAASRPSAEDSSVTTAAGGSPPAVASRPRLRESSTRRPGTYSPSAISATAMAVWRDPLRAMDHASPKTYRVLTPIRAEPSYSFHQFPGPPRLSLRLTAWPIHGAGRALRGSMAPAGRPRAGGRARESARACPSGG